MTLGLLSCARSRIAALGILLLAPWLSSCSFHCGPDADVSPSCCEFSGPHIFPNRSAGDTGEAPPYEVWHTKSEGTPVLLLHALGGLSGEVLNLALEIEKWDGYRVYTPDLYRLGKEGFGYNKPLRAPSLIRQSGRWNTRDHSDPGPILGDITRMSQWISKRENDARVIVIGNCLTGIFPVGLIDEDWVSAAVLCQPATPLKSLGRTVTGRSESAAKARALGIGCGDLNRMAAALRDAPEKRVYGFHFSHDPLAPIERFNVLADFFNQRRVGDQFVTAVLEPERAGTTLGGKSSPWTHLGTTARNRTWFTPHPTIVGKRDDPDVIWFRQHLRAFLEPHR